MEVEEAALDIHKVSITMVAAPLPMCKQLYYDLDETKQNKKSFMQKNTEGRNKDSETLRCWD